MRNRLLAALLTALLTPALSLAGWCPLSRSACGIEGLHSRVVEGIILVESGGNPWALHVGIGKGYSFYPKDRHEARRFLAVSLALTENVDIGLMQVNWRTWGKTVRDLGLSAYDLLDPKVNLRLGCHVLAQAMATRGSFEARLGRYHSKHRERGRWYARRVLAAARELEEGEGL
ncbi:MAG: transglycosylase SLT domain-containing protein [Candidatus Tectomicrobia bacterium]|nr:transglycosylase SLT domain-containing protein [Candidatus Tectomicrobia bacterium]